MKQRWLVTIAVSFSALALAASSVVASSGTKVDRGVGPLKPAKSDQQLDRGKHPGQAKHNETTELDESDTEELDGDHERKQNHGWFVSQVAHDKSLTGRAHGKAVSEAARSNQGKPDQPDN